MTLLEVYPARLSLLHPGFSIRLIVIDPFVVPKRRNGNHIHDNKEDQYDNVDNRHLSPTLFKASKYTSFARVTIVTELFLIIAPFNTIWISSN